MPRSRRSFPYCGGRCIAPHGFYRTRSGRRQGKHAELDAAPDGSSVMFCAGEEHMGMSLAHLLLDVPAAPNGLPDALAEEPEILVQAGGCWHIHQGGWSWDSTQVMYTYDEDYSDVHELVEQR